MKSSFTRTSPSHGRALGDGDDAMWDVLGYVFVGLLGLIVLIGLVVLVQAVPDVSRYRRIRKM
jgi:hypothetical protein